jgi:hypothetical protein
MGTAGSARAADEWYVLGEKTIKSGDPSTELKSKGDRWENDIKRTKISVQGADVEITKIVLHWDGRPDDTVSNVGVLKSGGETAPKDAPGLKARLASVVVQYKILELGGRPPVPVSHGPARSSVPTWGVRSRPSACRVSRDAHRAATER